ncbi:MAG: DNA glycosylase AlkZ-like family protein [Cellulomonadaceae bacterium]
MGLVRREARPRDAVLLGRGHLRRAQGFRRRYALAEHIIPAAVLGEHVPREDAVRELVRRSARACGVGAVADLADYYRLPIAAARTAVRELVEEGELVPVHVAGWSAPAYLAVDARVPRRLDAAALLSPFDPVVWFRPRAERLFDFHYRIEIYTPAHKRVYGYYTLPLLLGDTIVGRVDLKSDRQAGALRVQSAWTEPGAPDDVAERLLPLLEGAARWQGLERIEVAGRGNLALEHLHGAGV